MEAGGRQAVGREEKEGGGCNTARQGIATPVTAHHALHPPPLKTHHTHSRGGIHAHNPQRCISDAIMHSGAQHVQAKNRLVGTPPDDLPRLDRFHMDVHKQPPLPQLRKLAAQPKSVKQCIQR